MLLLWLLVFAQYLLVKSFVAYDCAGTFSDAPLQFGQFDLTKVIGKCDESVRAQYRNATSRKVQVLKFIANPKIDLMSCIVKVNLEIGNCGRGLLVTMAHQLKPIYKDRGYKLSKLDCEMANRNGTWKLLIHGHKLTIDTKSEKSTHTVYLYGRVNSDSSCQGATFTFAKKAHHRGILKADITLIRTFTTGTVALNLTQVYVKDQVVLDAASGYGYDNQFGTFVWNVSSIPSSTCERFRTVFAGTGDFYAPKEQSNSLKPLLIALRLESKTSVCGREAYKSNLDSIYVLVHGEFNEHLYTDLDSQAIENTDVDLYENILGITTGNYFSTQLVLDTSFASISTSMCKQEEINSLQSLTDWEKSGAGLLKPGYIHGLLGRVYGDMGVLFLCNPVEAEIRVNSECCKELPIKLVNSSMEVFMEPVSHRISSYCTPIPCSDTIKPRWRLGNQWYSVDSRGEAHMASSPEVIRLGNTSSMVQNVWVHSINKGIYSKEQLNSLRRIQEMGKARTVTNDQIHKLLEGDLQANELSEFAEGVPEAIISSIGDQILSPGLSFVNRTFKIFKITAIVVAVVCLGLAVTKCYMRAKLLRSSETGVGGIFSRIFSVISTIGLVSGSKPLYDGSLQCDHDDLPGELEVIKSELKKVKSQVDEILRSKLSVNSRESAQSVVSSA